MACVTLALIDGYRSSAARLARLNRLSHNKVAHGGIRRQALLSRAAAAKASIDGNSIA